MNFRTTILLLVLLVAAGAVLFFTKSREGATDETRTSPDESGQAGKKLIDVVPANVNKLILTSDTGSKLSFERSGTSEWKLLEPVNAPADAFKVDDLVRAITDLRTTGRSSAADKGLDKPHYTVELTDKSGKTTKLNIGTRSPVGDILYVRAEGQDQADIVSASIIDQLEKPSTEYRKNRLLTTANDKITGVTIVDGDKTLKLAKSDSDTWEILEPKKMPGDSGQISTLLSAITGIDAVKFVSEDAKNLASYGLTEPQMTITYTTMPPTTQPSTQPANSADTTTIKFGRAQDIKKKNVFLIASASGPVVTVAATAMDGLKKTPLDLRDRKVVELDSKSISKVTISIDKPATTQPTTQPASNKQVVLERRSEVAPATKPSTQSTTQPTTKPLIPPTKWLVASDPKGDADDLKVMTLLESFKPLRAEKYLEQFPTTQAAPVATYSIKIHTNAWGDEPAKDQDLKITDPGREAKLIGQLGELTFEMDRAILEKLSVEFAAPKVMPAGPALPLGPALPSFPGTALPAGHPPIPTK